ncbi:hypothetical protein D477_011756 [Arthrobacter crystallopoietes BAB-32]|uniref:STAS domain-containing protein n=1 Tax=Arthrobacter crystallopoietes BAB-32 TaxID=1246476 RepID=N1V212_9MICC|nr:hypothetical protein [Arthrobacter crystallopoietes]EMY34039.1 hypothetical protein D477_011756 [Arthrobacter crystallopoietes BAB-32]
MTATRTMTKDQVSGRADRRLATDRAEFEAASGRKIKVLVRLDTELQSARIQVGGTLTPENLRALYAVARRTNLLSPGMDILVDLSAARVQGTALEDLKSVARQEHLPRQSDPLHLACRLRVLEPAA